MKGYGKGMEWMGEVGGVVEGVVVCVEEFLGWVMVGVVVRGGSVDGDDEMVVVVVVDEEDVGWMGVEDGVDEEVVVKMVDGVGDVKVGKEGWIGWEEVGDNVVEVMVVGWIGVGEKGGMVVEDEWVVVEIFVIMGKVVREVREVGVIVEIE